MPLLGLGTRLVEKDLPMPNALYHELATWATINFAYTYKNEREVGALVLEACEPEKVGRLLTVIGKRLGHRVAFAVEDAKIVLSAERDAAVFLDFVEQGLAAAATRAGFEADDRHEDRPAAQDGPRLHRRGGARWCRDRHRLPSPAARAASRRRARGDRQGGARGPVWRRGSGSRCPSRRD